ncbi:MAG: hypothetical protein MUQ56_00010 [Thermoleophilia bacterium]|nr:hypothetical protein [Thermoleophilia bacterium]
MTVAPGRRAARWGSTSPLPFVASGIAVVVAQVVVARLPHTPWLELDAVLGFGLCLLPVAWSVWVLCSRPVSTSLLVLAGAVALGVALTLAWRGWLTVAVPFQVAAAAGLGILLARQVAAAWWLAAFAGVAILADAWSVFAGPTRQVVEHAPRALDYVLVHFSPLGGPLAGLGLGMSDLVFLALFLAGSRALGLIVRGGYAAMLGSFVVTVMLAVWWKPAVPALPLLSLAFLAVNIPAWAAMVRRRWRGGFGRGGATT